MFRLTTKAKKIFITLLVTLLAGFFVLWYFSLPDFKQKGCSTLVEDVNGNLLSARIAKDGQWRFPPSKTIPSRFATCIIEFEDVRFYQHIGVDFWGILRAIKENWKAKRIKSGGSTLTMQLVRLTTGNSDKNYGRKLWEILLAIRVELALNKMEILENYASWAPFGRNVVGLEAASWRYFGKSPQLLSWAESAALAVLPNNPSNIFPGKGQRIFKLKRDRLLLKLLERGKIDRQIYENALLEPLPGAPLPLPNLANHLLDRSVKEGLEGKVIKSTLKIELQERIQRLAQSHLAKLSANAIENAAVLVAEVESGKVIAYLGNGVGKEGQEFSPEVDIISSPRSTGSILKPLLYSMVLDEGKLLPEAIVADIPTIIGDYYPKNHDLTYDGAVSLNAAISRSLNVPAVRVLKEYGIEKFHKNLQSIGFTTFTKPANHYGLSLILGGGEATLWDVCKVYKGLAKRLSTSRTSDSDFNLKYFSNQTTTNFVTDFTISNGSLWHMFDAMKEVNRPDEELGWKDFNTSKIAWKTGTSFGNRDAWAIGVTPKYIVGVWVGNADGEGRPELTGIQAAAPLLFDVFKLLPKSNWFRPPYPDLTQMDICIKSGFKFGPNCGQLSRKWVQKLGKDAPFCPYCKTLSIDPLAKWQVNATCESLTQIQQVKWFVLPPVMEYYYKKNVPSYKKMPPFRNDCGNNYQSSPIFEVIYPTNGSKLFIPVEGDEKPGQMVVQVACRETDAELFWYLDGIYLGKTVSQHQMAIRPTKGSHKLSISHSSGQSKNVVFEIIN